jgi:triosephosphate isomerase
MHGLSSDLGQIKAIAEQSLKYRQVDVALCVPATLIERAARSVPGFAIGAQDTHFEEKGAHTGCISSQMLLDAGASLTIVGHSERRDGQHECNEEIKAKAEAALSVGLGVVLCVGESMQTREAGEAVENVIHQLDESLPQNMPDDAELAIAYEPVWAIGTGQVPAASQIEEMHAAILLRLADRHALGKRVGILYGGSVNPRNAKKILSLEHVDGALVGGASLTAAEFIPIVAVAAAVTDSTIERSGTDHTRRRSHLRTASLLS